ncbi:conserved hypothetical protein [Aspergillus terreus NIH2624]|uniref:NADH:flavin oxidoreductase/NADH oxidase N-terminal domain-containing protein n=1 Tax=Aspergillus terreus (strain NIH 2624 / FGSC A1156) TaxID=341663 RepID=Q0C8P4_ASPTN|nr:uncharacterized protein ATEG_09940 [Aspergillus terreus NIH2624]EAU30131.1 conserved hypothetical protein [Aspergillus terreus NIH2624]
MSTTKLFNPLRVGNVEVAHRITLPPLTPFRAGDGHIPLDMAVQYYEQRASIRGTLLISEAIVISPRAGVYRNVPGLWSPEQIAQWRKVTDAVHGKVSYIYAPLWAIGRMADIEATREAARVDAELISSSAVEYHPGLIPREMAEEVIKDVINDFRIAASNATSAGFDGVEIHGANGYLVDQFTQAAVNKRRDNPWSTYQGMAQDSDDELMEQFGYLARKTAEFTLAYVHLIEARVAGVVDVDVVPHRNLDVFFESYGRASPVMVAGGYDGESACEAADAHYKDYEVLVAIGRPWIANPGLPFRLRYGIPLRKYEREHFYTPRSTRGYIDYQFSDEFKARKAVA